MLVTYKTKEFPRDGRLWRIFGYGEVDVNDSVADERTVEVMIAPYHHPILLDSNYNKNCGYDFAQTRSVRIGIGQITALPNGSFLKDGRIVKPPKYTFGSFELNISKDFKQIIRADSTFKVGKSGEKLCYIPDNYYHTPAQAQGAKYLVYRLPERSGCVRELIIPCFEILRFYFGTSSRLINQIINGDELYNSDQRMTYIDADDTAYLRLKMKTLDSDASTVARIAFDKRVAADVNNIFDSMLVSRLAKQGAFPVVHFPFFGETKLEAQGKWIKSGEIWFFLVYFIEGCSGTFPFQKLRFDRDNNGNSDGVHDPNRKACTLNSINTHNQSRNFGKSKELEMTSDEEPSSYKTALELCLTSRVFSNIPVDVKKIIKEECTYRSISYVKSIPLRLEKNISTGIGAWNKSGTRPAIIKDKSEMKRKKREHAPVNLTVFLNVLEEICRCYPNQSSYSLISLNQHLSNQNKSENDGISFFPIFNKYGNVRRKIVWSLIKDDGEARRRSALVVEVIWREQKFYLLEAERRSAKNGASEEAISTLILSRSDGFIDDFTLSEVLAHCAFNKGVWLNDWKWNELDTQKYSHTWTVESFAGKLVEYFEQIVSDSRKTRNSINIIQDNYYKQEIAA